MISPSGPFGFRLLAFPKPLPEEFRIDVPFPLKYDCASSEAMKALARLPPFPFFPPFRSILRLMTTSLLVKFSDRFLAYLYQYA